MREHTPRGNKFEPLLRSVYRLALLALPHRFRYRWAADMRGMFRERLREAADSGGLRAAVATGSRELGSIALAAFQSRFEQATGRVHRAREAQDGSDVWRTDPVPAFFRQQDRRSLKVAGIGALACHFALFMVVLPGSGNLVSPAPDEPGPVILDFFRPPEPPKLPVITKPVRHVTNPVPIPDPTPDAPEPIYDSVIEYVYVIDETARPEFSVGLPAAPPAAVDERVWAGVEVERPRQLERAEPDYPELARRARLQCTVILEAVIGRQGSVVDVEVLRGCRLGLDEAAVAAVRQWQYTPTLLNGRPVEVVLTVTVQFQLRAPDFMASRARTRDSR